MPDKWGMVCNRYDELVGFARAVDVQMAAEEAIERSEKSRSLAECSLRIAAHEAGDHLFGLGRSAREATGHDHRGREKPGDGLVSSADDQRRRGAQD